MKISKKALFTAGGLFASTSAVFAQTSGSTSTFLPPALQSLFDLLGVGGSGTATFITNRVQFAIYVVLGLIILVAVAYSIMAGIKYIRSEGDPGKIEEAQKSIKAILMGIAAIFVGILGIILVYVIFNQSITPSSLPQVCISAGDSVGCKQYTNYGIDDPVVQWCEGLYKSVSAKDDQGNARFPDGIIGDRTNRQTLYDLTVNQGYAPPTIEAVDAGSGQKVTPTGTSTLLLCVNPLEGGYLPVNN